MAATGAIGGQPIRVYSFEGTPLPLADPAFIDPSNLIRDQPVECASIIIAYLGFNNLTVRHIMSTSPVRL